MFDSTIPFGEPELMRASRFRRYLPSQDGPAAPGIVSLSLASLHPSLLADLRCDTREYRSEPLDVLAACVRHAQPVTIHLQCGDRAVPLTVFPHARMAHCPLPITTLLALRRPELQVMHIEAALRAAPGDSATRPSRSGSETVTDLHPLGPLLWELALHGGRRELLPEIAGPAVYRVSYGLQTGDMAISGAMLAAVQRLRREPHHLRDIAGWPGFDRERAARLLNALYLQSGLIVSRSHPDALRDSWFSALGR
ncbi:MAG: hypothetical protein Q7T97_17665 [Burkholderiaceae bacterium]|nr:hypothetical protein [Burkholderiaceae bacterium]